MGWKSNACRICSYLNWVFKNILDSEIKRGSKEFNRVDISLYDTRRGKWQSFQIFIDAYENCRAMTLYGVVVQCM